MMEKIAYLQNINNTTLDLASELCLTSVLINEKNLNEDNLASIKDVLGPVSVGVCIDIFSGKDLLAQFGNAISQEATNKEAKYNDYFGVCPNNEEVRRFKLQRIQELIEVKNVSTIWLDSLHYPTYWQLPEPLIFDTCYCATCMKKFSEFIYGEKLPEKLDELVEAIDGQYYIEWLEFKCKTITSFVSEVKDLIRKSGKDIKLGAFIVPWVDKEYGSANTRILGQSLSELSEHVDFISPMLYFKALNRDIEWVSSTLEYYSAFGSKVIASVLLAKEISDEEVSKLLDVLSNKPLEGILISDLSGFSAESPKVSYLKKAFC